MLAPQIGAAYLIVLRMREFDGVGVPPPTFVQECRGGGAEAVGGGDIRAEAETTQGEVEGVLADRLLGRADAGKGESSSAVTA